jgi:hypothetical protein
VVAEKGVNFGSELDIRTAISIEIDQTIVRGVDFEDIQEDALGHCFPISRACIHLAPFPVGSRSYRQCDGVVDLPPRNLKNSPAITSG